MTELEYALTKEEWEELQLTISLDNNLVAYTDEEQQALQETIHEINVEATRTALTELIRRHRTEFTLLLNEERMKGLNNHEDNQLELFVKALLTNQ